MPILPIVKVPATTLRQRSIEIKKADLPKLKKLTREMIDTMYAADGIGLAAPQIGQNIRLVVIGAEAVKLSKLKSDSDLVLVNPVITKKSWRKVWLTEGCLSVPGKCGERQRHQKVSVKAWDLNGQTLNFEAKDFFAQVVQHEVDHLNGILYIDQAKHVKDGQEN